MSSAPVGAEEYITGRIHGEAQIRVELRLSRRATVTHRVGSRRAHGIGIVAGYDDGSGGIWLLLEHLAVVQHVQVAAPVKTNASLLQAGAERVGAQHGGDGAAARSHLAHRDAPVEDVEIALAIHGQRGWGGELSAGCGPAVAAVARGSVPRHDFGEPAAGQYLAHDVIGGVGKVQVPAGVIFARDNLFGRPMRTILCSVAAGVGKSAVAGGCGRREPWAAVAEAAGEAGDRCRSG